MKVLAINGSPRKNWNTAQLLQSALDGAKDEGAHIEMIHLYDYAYKGCVSCFACHLQRNMDNLKCFYQDDLTPVLEKCLEADAIIMGAPVYYSQLTGQFRSFMERFLFPVDTYYNDENGRVSKLKGHKPTALIIPMNMQEVHMRTLMHEGEIFEKNARIIEGLLHAPCHLQYAYDTLQFTSYKPYTVNIFDEKKKKERHDKVFPQDLQTSYQIGRQLVNEVKSYQDEV